MTKVNVGDTVQIKAEGFLDLPGGTRGVVTNVANSGIWPIVVKSDSVEHEIYLSETEAEEALEIVEPDASELSEQPSSGSGHDGEHSSTDSLLNEAEQAILLAARDDRPQAISQYLDGLIDIYMYMEAFCLQNDQEVPSSIYHKVHTEVEAAKRLLDRYIKDINN